ncbi:conserved protein of unknown function [Cyanobium sp. NIES-981]|nr:conserved protein of unknown function [Cyanobium sp. NIES-981]
MVLPEELCARLAELAAADSRTVSNMARVLIQQGIERLEQLRQSGAAAQPPALSSAPPRPAGSATLPARSSEELRQQLEQQQGQRPRRLRGAPRRLRLLRPR